MTNNEVNLKHSERVREQTLALNTLIQFVNFHDGCYIHKDTYKSIFKQLYGPVMKSQVQKAAEHDAMDILRAQFVL